MMHANTSKESIAAYYRRPCVCGEPATTTVLVHWQDADRRYRYCEQCAEDIVFAIEGAEVLP